MYGAYNEFWLAYTRDKFIRNLRIFSSERIHSEAI